MTRAKQFEHLVTTWPRRAVCSYCGRLVLEGLDLGVPYRVDAIPLTLTAEVKARLIGRRTYGIVSRHVFLRGMVDITAAAGTDGPPVVTDHTCAPVDVGDIAQEHVAELIAMTRDRYLEPATSVQQAEQDGALLLHAAVGVRVFDSPDDEEPPF